MIILRRRKKGVSEIVAAILLVLIVVSFSSMVMIYFYRQRSSVQHVATSQLSLAKKIQQQPVYQVYFAVFNTTDNTLTMLINIGSGYIEFVSVYINDTLVNTADTQVYLNGNQLSNPQEIVVNQSGVNILVVKNIHAINANPGDTIVVKLVASTGTSDTGIGRAVS